MYIAEISPAAIRGRLVAMQQFNVCVGIWHDELIARVGGPVAERVLANEGVREFDITGRAMEGWVLVAPERLRGRGLRAWLDRSLAFVRTLPAKSGERGTPL
jgi:hypothetical protein